MECTCEKSIWYKLIWLFRTYRSKQIRQYKDYKNCMKCKFRYENESAFDFDRKELKVLNMKIKQLKLEKEYGYVYPQTICTYYCKFNDWTTLNFIDTWFDTKLAEEQLKKMKG